MNTELQMSYCLKRRERSYHIAYFLLSSLKILFTYEMKAVKEISSVFYGDNGAFSSLQELTFWDMPNLERWSLVAMWPTKVPFPYLTHLNLKGCPKLTIQLCLPPSILAMKIYFSNTGVYLASYFARWTSSCLKKLEV